MDSDYTQSIDTENLGAGGLFSKPKQQATTNFVSPSDTARSVSYGQVIEILCSGGKYGIQGLVGGDIRESIYLDETPIARQGTVNFKGIEIFERRGTPFQPPLDQFNSELVSEESVGVEVKFNSPVTRGFTNENVTAIRIRMSFVLQKNRIENGQVVGTIENDVGFKVFIKEGNGGFTYRGDLGITGKFSEPFEKIWWFSVNLANKDFLVRLERITPTDDANSKRIIRWESYSVIVATLLPFKRIAYVGLKFNAEDFGTSIPERRYFLRGMFLDLPTNASVAVDDGAVGYSGNWDGAFLPNYTRACSDYAWIILFLLTDEIDGVGDQIKPHMVDRYSLYEISLYNNEIITGALGNLERRYLFNGCLNKQTDAWRMIDSILSGCNARKVWENGVLRFIQDRPESIFSAITNADVLNGEFTYSSTDITEISTAIQITYTDATTGKTKQEFISDATLINQIGYRLKQVEAVGCSSRSQAIRHARSIIYSENYEQEICTFQVRNFGAFIPVGKVIAVQDNSRDKKRLGGLVKPGSTASVINLDYPVEIYEYREFDDSFYLLLYPDVRENLRRTGMSALDHYTKHGINEGRHPNGYLLMCLLPNFTLEIRYVVNPPGVHTSIFVESAFTQVPNEESTFILISPEIPQRLYRIESKEISSDNPDVCTLTCKEHAPYKWEQIERGIDADQYNAVIIKPYKPFGVTNITGALFVSNVFNLELSWKIPVNNAGQNDLFINRYLISYRLNDGLYWENETVSNLNNFTFSTATPGKYEFRIQAGNIFGYASDYAYSQPFYISR